MHIRYLILVFIIISSITVYAQDITGNIEGQIVDTSGTPMFGVNISLQSENLQGIRGGTTDEKGYFQILHLPLGSYNVKISSVGYQSTVFENVQIALGKTTNLGVIHLRSQSVNLSEVVVSGNKSIIDPASTTYGGNLKSKDFEGLPISRDYYSMFYLLPQANSISIGGGTLSENKFIVDGVDVDDPGGEPIATRLPYNFIKEIELKVGGYGPEFESSTSGVVNMVTYSGTNEFHGSVFGYYTNNSFTRHSELAPSQGNFSDYDIGFGIGGPIIHDKLWFFAAYNPSFNRKDVNVPGFGTSLDKTLIHRFAAKLNWSAAQNLNFIFTITGSPSNHLVVGSPNTVYGSSLFGTKFINSDPYFFESDVRQANIALIGNYIINQNLFLQASFSRVFRSDRGTPSTIIGQEETFFYDIPDRTISGGYPNSYYDSRYANTLKIKGTLKTGEHTVIAGIEYWANIIDFNERDHEIDKKNTTVYEEYIDGNFGETQMRLPSFFVQDSWRIFRSFRIYAGIRFGEQFLLGSDNKVDQKIAIPLQPRVGFTFIPSEDGSQKIFGSFGRFTQELGLYSSVDYYNSDRYNFQIYFNHNPFVDNTGGDTVYKSNKIHAEVSGLTASYLDEFSLGYQRLFGKNLSVSIQGVYRILRETIDDAYATSLGIYILGNPGKGILSDYPKPYRKYSALIFTVEHRLDEHLNFLASYILSRNYGNYDGLYDPYNRFGNVNESTAFNNVESSQTNLNGLLFDDQTHQFKFSGYYQFQFGLTAGVSFDYESGIPLNKYELGRYLGNNYVKFLVPRGTAGRTPSTWTLSSRIKYDLPFKNLYHVKIMLDIFNIASQLKPLFIGQSVSSPTYGRVLLYQDPMSARLGMEISF